MNPIPPPSQPATPPNPENNNAPQTPPANQPPLVSKSLLWKLVEIDMGLHVLALIGLITLTAVIIFLIQPKKPSAELAKNGQIAQVAPTALNPTVEVAAPNEKPNIYIETKVIPLEKAFNSEPTQIKLTLNGQIKKEIFGYFPYWAISEANNINLEVLTAVSYFGLEVGPDGSILKTSNTTSQIGDAWNVWQYDPRLTEFIKKLRANKIKVLLTFKAFSNSNIEQLVSSPTAKQAFITNVLYQVNSKNLDGVNIDFEYVGTPPDQIRDKFGILISDLNKALKQQDPNTELTIATYATAARDSKFFDIPLLAKNSDGLVIMGYDFSTPYSANSGPVAPMGGSGQNLFDSLNAYLAKAPANKLILAVGYYGYDWPTKDKTENSQVITGSMDVNTLTYAEIIENSKKNNINWNDITKTPWYSYLTKEGQIHIVHFENIRSLGIKYDFVNLKNLKGIGIWALGFAGRNSDLDQLIADKFTGK